MQKVIVVLLGACSLLAGCDHTPTQQDMPDDVVPYQSPDDTPDFPSIHLMADPFDTGGGEEPGTGEFSIAVVPSEWYLSFDNGEHHLKNLQVRTDFEFFHTGDYWIDWRSRVQLADKNGDDPYRWHLRWTVFGLPKSKMIYGESPIASRTGDYRGPIISRQVIQRDDLIGFDAATIVLTGWRYGFWNDDHHIREITTRLYDVHYNPDVGEISWRFQLAFSDRNFDDDFYARYNWLVIACSDCAILQGTVSDVAGSHELFGPVGYEQGVLLPQSWHLEIDGGWMHDKELQTIWGRLNWNFLPANKTFLANLEGELQGDDPNYGTTIARTDVVGILFDKGAVTSYETGTINSSGDWDEKDYRLNLPEPFWSWVW